MAANRIYRGPAERDPETVSDKTVAGAYLPGTFVSEGATTFTQATTAKVAFLRLLADRDFLGLGGIAGGNPLTTAYASGDTGVAYKLEVGQTYQAACAAATYAWGTELTVAAAGRVAAASSGDAVIGWSRAVGAKSAGDLIDFEVANSYEKA
jgi:hypothetical protein